MAEPVAKPNTQMLVTMVLPLVSRPPVATVTKANTGHCWIRFPSGVLGASESCTCEVPYPKVDGFTEP